MGTSNALPFQIRTNNLVWNIRYERSNWRAIADWTWKRRADHPNAHAQAIAWSNIPVSIQLNWQLIIGQNCARAPHTRATVNSIYNRLRKWEWAHRKPSEPDHAKWIRIPLSADYVLKNFSGLNDESIEWNWNEWPNREQKSFITFMYCIFVCNCSAQPC